MDAFMHTSACVLSANMRQIQLPFERLLQTTIGLHFAPAAIASAGCLLGSVHPRAVAIMIAAPRAVMVAVMCVQRDVMLRVFDQEVRHSPCYLHVYCMFLLP